MNTPRDTTLEYQLEEAEVAAILSESPDATLVADYLGGVLDPDQASVFRERLRTDAPFRTFAQPRLDAWYALSRAMPESTPEELHAAWMTFRRKAGLTVPQAAPSPLASAALDEVRREAVSGVRFLRMVAILLLIVGIPVSGFIGYRLFPTVRAQAVYMERPNDGEKVVMVDRPSTARLETRARLFWQDHSNDVGNRELFLTEGAGTFTLSRRRLGIYVVSTPAGRVRANGSTFRVELRSPAEAVIRVTAGEVQLEQLGATTDSIAPLTLRAGERGRLIWGQPPRREP
jgi:ferric-dicitrate binding protein FerR (iron transport regulator)